MRCDAPNRNRTPNPSIIMALAIHTLHSAPKCAARPYKVWHAPPHISAYHINTRFFRDSCFSIIIDHRRLVARCASARIDSPGSAQFLWRPILQTGKTGKHDGRRNANAHACRTRWVGWTGGGGCRGLENPHAHIHFGMKANQRHNRPQLWNGVGLCPKTKRCTGDEFGRGAAAAAFDECVCVLVVQIRADTLARTRTQTATRCALMPI